MSYRLMFAVACLIYVQSSTAQEYSQAIEDNSFFIEEAINQEDHVVQHISNGYFLPNIHEFLFTFTQEWPIGGQTHQLSYTVPFQTMENHQSGIGDLFLNYRFQIWDGGDWAWVAPRLSLILPTGRSSAGFGSGVTGFQFNLPVSKRVSERLYMHLNAGFTVLPGVEGVTGSGTAVRKTLSSYFAGLSGILLLTENINIMTEVLQSSSAAIGTDGGVVHSTETILSPGLRVAVDVGSLQIVPGVAVPISMTAGGSTTNVYAYLSFEHPF
jgi:hypothetical protein